MRTFTHIATTLVLFGLVSCVPAPTDGELDSTDSQIDLADEAETGVEEVLYVYYINQHMGNEQIDIEVVKTEEGGMLARWANGEVESPQFLGILGDYNDQPLIFTYVGDYLQLYWGDRWIFARDHAPDYQAEFGGWVYQATQEGAFVIRDSNDKIVWSDLFGRSLDFHSGPEDETSWQLFWGDDRVGDQLLVSSVYIRRYLGQDGQVVMLKYRYSYNCGGFIPCNRSGTVYDPEHNHTLNVLSPQPF